MTTALASHDPRAITALASHDPRVISVFEIVGSYFVDVVYNHVYSSARGNLSGGGSITDGYVASVQSFVLGTKNDAGCYADVVQGVHKYFTQTTRFTALSFADFVDRIVGACVPEEYFRQLALPDKDEMLSSVLCDLVSNLAAFATKPDVLRRVIDDRDRTPAVTIRMLQDAAVQALVSKRATLYNHFLRKAGQARDNVPADMLDEMKGALRRLVKEKAAATARASKAEDAVVDLAQQLRESKTREAKLRKLVSLLRQGRDLGPAAVGDSLRLPARDTLAEDPLDLTRRGDRRPPRRERIAEGGSSEESGEDSYEEGETGESSDSYESSPRPAARRPVPKAAPRRGGPRAQPAVPAGFFKAPAALQQGPAALQRGPAPPQREPAPVTAASLRAVAVPVAPRAAAGGPSPLMLSLLDNAVDVGGAGDDSGFGDFDEYLRG